MLKLKDQVYYENERDWREGSIILFPHSIENIKNKSNLSKLQTKRVQMLFESSKRVVDKVLTKKEIVQLLGLTPSTTSRFIQELVKKEILIIIENYKHHSNRKNLFAYRLNCEDEQNKKEEIVLFNKNKKESNELIPSNSLEIGDFKGDNKLRLANTYSARVNFSEDDFCLIDESRILSALMGDIKAKMCFADFFVKEGEKKKTNSKILANYSSNEVDYKAKATLESDIQCLSNSDIKMIYTLVNLTLKYHLHHSESYTNYPKGQEIINATPIARDDILAWLGLTNNTERRAHIHKKLKLIENNKFSLERIRSAAFTDSASEFKKLFTIIGSASRTFKGASTIPFKYIIKWDVNVLKQIFLTKTLYLYPQEVIRQPMSIFMLYKWSRSLDKRKVDVELSATQLKRILNTESNKKTLAKLIKDFKKAFPKTTKVKFYNKKKQNRVVEFESRGSVGGILFGMKYVAPNRIKTDNDIQIEVFIYIDRKSVMLKSQPEIIRNKFFHGSKLIDLNGMGEENRGIKSPVVFSNTLPNLHCMIEDDDKILSSSLMLEEQEGPAGQEDLAASYEYISNTEEAAGLIEEKEDTGHLEELDSEVINPFVEIRNDSLRVTEDESKYYTIRVRKHSISIYVEGFDAIFISRYTRRSELVDYSKEISKRTGQDQVRICERILKALQKVKLFKGVDDIELAAELFHDCTMLCNHSTEDIVKEIQKRIRTIKLIDVESKEDVKEFICGLPH